MDRGEFRWEMLCPWLHPSRSLTRLDKVVICVAFVGIAIAIQHAIEPRQTLTQHFAYVANFFSYAVGNPVGFRVIAIVASVLDILDNDGNGFAIRDDAIPDGYNLIFIVVNSYYVMRYVLNNSDVIKGALNPVEAKLYARCFEPLGVGPYQFLKLAQQATWVTATRRVALTVEGEPLKSLFVSISGDFDVKTNGLRVASIPPFNVVGEVAALENLQSDDGAFHQAARATVLAEKGSVYVKWRHDQLYALQAVDEDFARAIRLAISRTLSHKLGSARRATSELVATSTNPDALRLLPVTLPPDQERIYRACLLKHGFDDVNAFDRFLKLARKIRITTPDRLDLGCGGKMLAVATGEASAFDRAGLKVQAVAAPQLVGVERFLENLVVFAGLGVDRPDSSQQAVAECLAVAVQPPADLFVWDLPDVAAAVRADEPLRAALSRLYLSTWADAPKKAQTIVATGA